MQEVVITESDVALAAKNLKNWKSPGCDNIQNFWLKSFTKSHIFLANAFQKLIDSPSKMPSFLTEGITYTILKSTAIDEPNNYRPITCLSTTYKLLTSIV